MYHIVAPILSHLGASEWRILAEYFGYTTKTVKTSDIARAIYNHNHKEAQRKLEAAADRMAECKAGGDYKGFYRALQAFRDAEDH